MEKNTKEGLREFGRGSESKRDGSISGREMRNDGSVREEGGGGGEK